MIRAAYNWNHVFDDGGGSLDFLFEFSGTSGTLGGGSRLPSNWIADFRRLYDFTEAGRNDLRPIVGGRNKMNFARRIDTLLADPLADLRPGSIGGPEPVARAPQPGLPQPHPGADAEPRHRPADAGADALARA